ncbi:hypothetical protein NM688_g5381 [Phlebia brevispora]|uniref:Uncharacterized protein n=1 Tax=Phlebia brevispora TaxID=194682 RepID=A0ACC1SVY3_9APHY|nr:hypothetical protein NM688_g5381 [Phlebia brevispora]
MGVANLLIAAIATVACILTQVVALPSPLGSPRPLVIWHGMGDSYASPGILEFMEMIRDMHPGIFVHSVYINENLDEDRRAGWFGNLNEQLANVSLQLNSIPELEDGFDALGFSQGGLFFRAYVERYNSPPVHNMIAFGSPHMGVSDLPVCKPWDLLCQLARRATRGGVYGEWAQENLVQAQYFRDPEQLDLYLSRNKWLTSINNEIPDSVNTTYAKNLESLNKLILVLFSEDTTVVPKESAWFGSYAPSNESSSADKAVIPMRLQPLYTENRIGLKTLDQRGDIVLATCVGEHMQLTPDCWKPLVQKYAGGKPDGDVAMDGQTVLTVQ